MTKNLFQNQAFNLNVFFNNINNLIFCLLVIFILEYPFFKLTNNGIFHFLVYYFFITLFMVS